MIPIGSLLYSLIFKDAQKVQDETGFESIENVVLFKCRAAKVKQSGKYLIDAKELFHTNSLVFKIRNNKLLTEFLIVEYEKADYKITSFDRNLFDNSITITIEKINE